jgi:aldose 1-epimerase
VRSVSGEQYEIVYGGDRVVVTEAGAGLRSYTSDGRDVLDGYGPNELAPSGRGQVLIPWPNRITGGRYAWEGEELQLPLTEPEAGNAIHGLVRWDAWRATVRERHSVVLRHELQPQPGYPFPLALQIEYALSDRGLRVSTSATNLGERSCPYGAGAHPYLFPGTRTVDTAILHLPARSVLEADPNGVPVAVPVEGTERDHRDARAIGSTIFDHCFTDLMRDADGVVHVTLGDPATGRSVSLWVDEHYPYLMLYTGDTRPDVSRRSLAVEPMTCPPQAFRSGQSVVVLEPGASTGGAWGIAPSREG